jgi:uncharacterized protein CbrC (UPF0167 family)
MSDLSPFQYIHDIRFSCESPTPEVCVICGVFGRAFWLLVINESDHDDFFVCESCLSAGRLTEKDLQMNEADSFSLARQLRSSHPELSEEELRAAIIERTREVEKRTPRPIILNTFVWPAHCGDYLIFHKQVSSEDLNQVAEDADGKAFFTSRIPAEFTANRGPDALDREWEHGLNGFWRFYLWRCRECREYVLTYDCE